MDNSTTVLSLDQTVAFGGVGEPVPCVEVRSAFEVVPEPVGRDFQREVGEFGGGRIEESAVPICEFAPFSDDVRDIDVVLPTVVELPRTVR